MQKVLLVTNIPTPYRVPLFNVIHTELAVRHIDFKVIFAALAYGRRQWRVDMNECHFPYEVLPPSSLISDPKGGSFTYKSLDKVFQREKPAVIITNGFSVATTKLWLRSLMRQTRYLVWSGATPTPETREGAIRRLHRRILVQRATAFVAYGSLARDYLLDLGARPENVSVGINTVDTAFFTEKTQRHDDQSDHIDGKNRILFIGELIRRKGADRLMISIQSLARKRKDFILDIIGSGSEQGKLVQMAEELGITEHVNFVGFKQRHEMPYYMSRASCFVFPTRHDIWGLVLVEAMSAGLPCISSKDAGATWDLIRDGQTGFAVDFSEADIVTEKMEWLLDHPEECARIGRQARQFIQNEVTLKKSAEGFVTAIQRVLVKSNGELASRSFSDEV